MDPVLTKTWRREHSGDVPGGLVAVGTVRSAGVFWVRRPTDPGQWTVAVCNGGIWRYGDEPVVEKFDCGAVEFLVGFVTGRVPSRGPGIHPGAADRVHADNVDALVAHLPKVRDAVAEVAREIAAARNGPGPSTPAPQRPGSR